MPVWAGGSMEWWMWLLGRIIMPQTELEQAPDETGGAETNCDDAFIWALPFDEIDFMANAGEQDVESVSLMTGGPLDVELRIVSDDGGSTPFQFWDPVNHCALIEDETGQTCGIMIDDGDMPVIPIVYTPGDGGGNGFDVGWIHLNWWSGDVLCEGNVVMLDGEVGRSM